ncbi:unnamed protein product [Phaedon cochleariae]|uniref:Uncharacterized protein n=1 Tax=Phaedon cochleariae TaxID=80249 RepID=A0A9N9SHP1_PHACE|nr:unnamed protein product [Phaedon cochleariae]
MLPDDEHNNTSSSASSFITDSDNIQNESLTDNEILLFDDLSSSQQVSILNSPVNEGSTQNNHYHPLNTVEKLKNWAVENKVTLIDSKPEYFHGLPRDARTFLATPKFTVTRKVDPGEYYHFGLQKSIEDLFKRISRAPSSPIEIGINIDGLPIAESSSSQFYPILGLESKDVFLIGLYHGYEKPKICDEFLSDFIEEAIKLTNNTTSKFLNSYLMLLQKHPYWQLRVKQQTDAAHHTDQSISLDIPNIDIIADVPSDYMHLVLLGVVKKLLCGLWCFGPPPHKFSSAQFTGISELLINLIPSFPSDFARKPRSLKEVKRWKATEFRHFLLYTGPVVLINVLPKKKYQHFLILLISIRILSSEKYCPMYIDYVEELIIYSVKSIEEIYGSHLLTHNFHNLLHLVDDVRKFGVLDNFSNFEYENFLQYLGTLIRKHDKPLQQVVRRYYESMNCREKVNVSEEISDFNLIKPHCDGPLVSGCSRPEFRSVVFPKFKLSCTLKDSSCALEDGTIIEIENFAFSPVLNENIVDMPWIIVQFSDSEEIVTVPYCWYNGSRKSIFYPSYPKNRMEKAIKNEVEPESDWQEYNVSLMRNILYDNFKIACAKASKCCVTSEVSELECLSEKRKPKRTKFTSSEDSGSDLDMPRPRQKGNIVVGIIIMDLDRKRKQVLSMQKKQMLKKYYKRTRPDKTALAHTCSMPSTSQLLLVDDDTSLTTLPSTSFTSPSTSQLLVDDMILEMIPLSRPCLLLVPLVL